MKLELHHRDSKTVTKEMSESWNEEYNEGLVHQVVIAELAGQRQGTKAQKNRGALTQSNQKPWKQKGTGRARAGDKKNPLWRKGGVTFAQRDVRDHSHKVNKKMRKKAFKVILSKLAQDNKISIVSDDFFAIDAPKTKEIVSRLAPFDITKCLVVVHEFEANMLLSFRNIPTVKIITYSQLSAYDLIRNTRVLMTESALAKIEEERLS
jgi:large subunit ribosomal protein L4